MENRRYVKKPEIPPGWELLREVIVYSLGIRQKEASPVSRALRNRLKSGEALFGAGEVRKYHSSYRINPNNKETMQRLKLLLGSYGCSTTSFELPPENNGLTIQEICKTYGLLEQEILPYFNRNLLLKDTSINSSPPRFTRQSIEQVVLLIDEQRCREYLPVFKKMATKDKRKLRRAKQTKARNSK